MKSWIFAIFLSITLFGYILIFLLGKNNTDLGINKNNHNTKITAISQTQSKKNIEYFPLIESNVFSVNIPEKYTIAPQINTQNILSPTNNSSAQVKTYTYYSNSSKQDNFKYIVSNVLYSSDIFQLKSSEALFTDLRNGQLKDYKGYLKKELTSYETNNYQKREIEIHTTQLGKELYVKSFLILAQPYVLIFSLESDKLSNLSSQKAQEYFNSIKIFQANQNTLLIQ